MRQLNQEEKRLTTLINNGQGNNLQNLIDNLLVDVRISINTQNRKVELLYEINNPIPSHEEAEKIIGSMNRLSLEIIITVNLFSLLEKDGYIFLYERASQIDNILEFGQGADNMPAVSYNFPDKKISDLLVDYSSKDIIVTPELNEFVKHGFIARDEQRFKRQIKTATIALIIAFFAALTNLVFNLWTKFSGGTQIKQEQIDSLTGGMKEIEIRLDTLNLRIQQFDKKPKEVEIISSLDTSKK